MPSAKPLIFAALAFLAAPAVAQPLVVEGVGVEMLPMKERQSEMSSGVAY